MVKDREIKGKPMSVVLLTVLCIVLGVFALATAITALVLGSDTILDVARVIRSLDATVISVIGIVFGCLFLAMGVGFWLVRGWAKSILLVLTALGVVYYPLRLALLTSSLIKQETAITSSDFTGLGLMIVGAVLSVLIVGYISRQKLILVFEAQEMELTKRKIRAEKEKIELGRQRCNAGEVSKAELKELKLNCQRREGQLRGKIKHLEKLRLSREKKLKDRVKAKEKAKEDKRERKEKKKEEREEKKVEKEEKRAEKETKKEEKKEEEGEKGKGKAKEEEKKGGKKKTKTEEEELEDEEQAED